MRRLLICLLALFAACAVRGAEPPRLDSADYDYPVLHVRGQHSASFGEMRPNHFHSGIDIKTDGAEGKPVVAAASGYVSRIVVSPTGYGRALYLTLDNGYTAVYGHLSRFRDDLEQFAESERRRLRRNKVDLSCPPDRFRVCRGDRIAFSGNTGSSFGPHLHFELRETATQRTLNLVRQGIARPEDDMPPVIVRIRYIETDTVQGVPVHRAPAVCDAVRVDAGTYRLARPTPLPVGANGSFVVEATDRRNGVTNTFGLYRVTLYVDGEPHYEYRMDGFTFDRSRDCNVAACYSVQIASRNEAIRLARVEGAPDFFCPVAVRRGAVGAAEGERRSLRIEAEDDCGNVSHLDFEVVGRAPWHAVRDTLAVRCDRSRTHVLTCPGARAVLPAGALYESAFLRLRPSGVRIACDTSLLVLSPRIPLPALHRAAPQTRGGADRSLRAGGAAAACGAGRARPPGPSDLRRGHLLGRRSHGPHRRDGRSVRGGGYRGALRASAFRRGCRPGGRTPHVVPDDGQLFGHRLVRAAHRRRVGPL